MTDSVEMTDMLNTSHNEDDDNNESSDHEEGDSKNDLPQLSDDTSQTTTIDPHDSNKKDHISIDKFKEFYEPQQKAVIVINDKIYDVTEFLDEHPGGREILEEYLYRDCTNAFNDVGHSDAAKREMQKFEIGIINKTQKNIQIEQINQVDMSRNTNECNSSSFDGEHTYDPKTDNCAKLDIRPNEEDLGKGLISLVISGVCYYVTGNMYISSMPTLLYLLYLTFGFDWLTTILSPTGSTHKDEQRSPIKKKLE